MKRIAILFALVAANVLVAARAQETVEDPDLTTLKKAGIPATAAGIIQHIDEISPTPGMIKTVDKLIQQLGTEPFRDRRSAQKKLISLGQLAEAKVTAALQSKDPEIRDQAKRIINCYDNHATESVLVACINQLAKTKAGSAGVAALLKAAPLYVRPYVTRSAEAAMMLLAGPDDLPLLLKTAADPESAARGVAVVTCAELLGVGKTDKIRPYLQDKDPKMALATARAIANVGEREAIPVFLRLMAHEDVNLRQESSVLLLQFTRANIWYSAYANKVERSASLTKWRAWADGDGEACKLHFPLVPRGGGSYLNGHTLIAMGNGGKGVVELNRQKKEVWRYPFQDCWAAQKLANGNYLIGSYSRQRLVEVTPKKKIVWEYPVRAMGVQQLANGNVLAATAADNSVVEIDKRKEEVVWEYKAEGNCHKAYRLPNGNTLVAGYKFIREVTPKRKVVWEYNQGTHFYSVQPLANGNMVVCDHDGAVYELNRKKERVWEINQRSTTGAYKTSKGNVLVVQSGKVTEFTQKGKEIWSYSGNSYGFAHQ